MRKPDPVPPHIKKLRLLESIDRLERLVRMDAPQTIQKFATLCITARIYGGELGAAKYHLEHLIKKIWQVRIEIWLYRTWWCFWNGKSREAWADHIRGEPEGTTAIDRKELEQIMRGEEPSDKVN